MIFLFFNSSPSLSTHCAFIPAARHLSNLQLWHFFLFSRLISHFPPYRRRIQRCVKGPEINIHKPKWHVFESCVSSVNQNLLKSRRRVIFRIKNLNQGSKSFRLGPTWWSGYHKNILRQTSRSRILRGSLHCAQISLPGFWTLTGTKREGCPWSFFKNSLFNIIFRFRRYWNFIV